MSRTETELLDRQVRRLLHGKNVSGCICPLYPNQKYFTGIKIGYEKFYYAQEKINPLTSYHDACQINVRKQKQSLNIAIILVPFSSIERLFYKKNNKI